MMYLERVEAHWPLRLHMPAGTRVPLHCTANGKLYMALMDKQEQRHKISPLNLEKMANNTLTDANVLIDELAKIRHCHYATDNQEFISGMIGVSVPITDSRGRMIAGIVVIAPIARVSLDEAVKHLPDLRDAADKLSNYLDRL